MKVRDQHEIDLLGGIAGAAKAGLQATERPSAPPLSGAGVHENDLLPGVHEKTRFGAVEEVRFFLHRARDGGHDFLLPVQPARLELAASVVERCHLEIADSEAMEAGYLIMMLGCVGPDRHWMSQRDAEHGCCDEDRRRHVFHSRLS